MIDRPLRGRSIVTTRASIGRLDHRLAALGADVVHVPLIETVDATDGGSALDAALGRLRGGDWVVVTSPAGAVRLTDRLPPVDVRIGAVGPATAAAVAAATGRHADLVPESNTGADLAAALPAPGRPTRLVIAQADRADASTADAIAARGYTVDRVVAYRTVTRLPTSPERRVALASDAVVFASGSAVTAWVASMGTSTPPVVISIGPSTTAVADDVGVSITDTASPHSGDGLVEAVVRQLGPAS
jgi:uroporphyrinogen-III synthase